MLHYKRSSRAFQQVAAATIVCVVWVTVCWVRVHVARHDHTRLVCLDEDGLLYQWFSTVVHGQ